MRRIGLLVALLVLAAPAAAQADKAFRTPSKNIYCRYVTSAKPKFVRCDVLSLNDVGFILGRKARRARVTDSVVSGGAKTLGYGKRLRLGPFTCRSTRKALTCKRRRNGHGFRLSREKQRVF